MGGWASWRSLPDLLIITDTDLPFFYACYLVFGKGVGLAQCVSGFPCHLYPGRRQCLAMWPSLLQLKQTIVPRLP